MVGNIKFHHAAPQLLEPLRLGADDHAFGDRRGAGCGVAVAPFHLDQAETAGTEALDAVGGAQLGDRTAQQRGGAHDAGPLRQGDVLAVDRQAHGLAAGPAGRGAVIGFARDGHASCSAACLTGAGAPTYSGKWSSALSTGSGATPPKEPSEQRFLVSNKSSRTAVVHPIAISI